MSKKLLTISMCIMIAAALVGGATMAWFTDAAESEQATFEAGTLLVEAGTVSLYGVEYGRGNENLYEILIDEENEKVNKVKIFESVNGNYLNGLAYDNPNHRLYYACENSNLYFYNFDGSETLAGNLADHTVWGATFGNGSYWYIKEGTDDLYRVSFDGDGTINTVNLEAENITGNDIGLGFGDLAMELREGILYGSTSGHDGTPQYFFSYNIYNDEFNVINDGTGAATNLQIAFASDSNLYGHLTRGERWYKINPAEGTKDEFYRGDVQFSDLASNFQNNWNPGDCDMARYYVTNTGTKDSYVRAELLGEWVNNDLNEDNIEISLCESMHDWEEQNSKFYYKEVLEPEEQVLLCVSVCLDGEGTGNEYQGESYELSSKFEVIQTSNDASENEWGWSP